MSAKKTDSKAIEKTKCRLRAALCKLLETKSIDKITVIELTEEAYLSRGTFYLYYSDINEFYNCSVDYVFRQFNKQLLKFLDDGADNAKDNCKEENLIVTATDRELIRIYTKNNNGWSYYNKILLLMVEDFYTHEREIYGDDFFERNMIIFRMFWPGYVFSMMKAFENDDLEMVYSNLMRSISIRNFMLSKAK